MELDIAMVPSRRTLDPDDVDISWQLDAFRFDLPMMGSAMEGAISPATAIEIGRLGGVTATPTPSLAVTMPPRHPSPSSPASTGRFGEVPGSYVPQGRDQVESFVAFDL